MPSLYHVFTNITLLQISCFYKYHAFTSPVLTFFKNSRQTYALHLMNSLLNKFCYIISNVSIRKNRHRVQLMTESYPDRQNYSEKQCLLRMQGAWLALPNQSGATKLR